MLRLGDGHGATMTTDNACRHEAVRTAAAIGTGVSGRVVALLTVAAFINYVDRGNLATAGPLIRDQFALSNAQLGVLLSAFFWTYTPSQLPAGWLAERLDPRRVLAAGLAIWGAATALTGLATGFLMLLLLRVTLGLGESVMFAASFKILARDALDGQKGRANGFMAAGLLCGSAFGTLAGGLLMAWFGWRVVFNTDKRRSGAGPRSVQDSAVAGRKPELSGTQGTGSLRHDLGCRIGFCTSRLCREAYVRSRDFPYPH
jgi:nitrate/nitrite transporter NarK